MRSMKTTPKKREPDMTAKCSLHRLGLCSVKECDRDCAEHYDLEEIIAEVKSWG